jgi:hybrid cluster-associated redox disulfide protein
VSQLTVTTASGIADLLERCPCAMRVFFRRRMACVGCAMAPFEDIGVAAANYGLPAAQLVAELSECVAAAPRSGRDAAPRVQ